MAGMRGIVKAALSALMVMVILSLVIPAAVAYPPAIQGKAGSVSGKVTSQAGVAVDNARVTIVNASNASEVYASTTTDSTGHYTFSGVNATYDSVSGESVDGHGGSVYRIYALKSPYGDGYASPFHLDASSNSANVNVVILPGLTNVTLGVDMIATTMVDDKCAKITAYVYDASGQPAPDGVVVDFAVDEQGWTAKKGCLNKDGRQYATATTSGGQAFVYYGWFPAGASPANNTVTASVHYFSNIKASTDLYFPAAPQATPTPSASATPSPTPKISPTPLPTATKTPTVSTTPTKTPTMTATSSPPQENTQGSIIIYVVIGILVIVQIVGLFLGLRLLKKK